MVTRDTPWPAGTPCWVDLGVDDVARAMTFYRGLFGWDIQPGPPEAGGYAMCLLGGRAAAGIGPKMGQTDASSPNAWTTYLAADNLDDVAARVTTAGGQVTAGPMDVLDVGRMAIAADPAGAMFGIWQARAHTGAGVANEPGSLCWNENMSRGMAANQAFYRAVFGYDYDDMSGDGFKYATLKVGDAIVGGIGELPADVPAEVPANWSVYFAVADTDAALGTVTGLGGGIVRPAWDSPYGTMATVSDDQGAVFSLIGITAADGG
jgi:predicted enzyme related to lactoylglutathione lyase